MVNTPPQYTGIFVLCKFFMWSNCERKKNFHFPILSIYYKAYTIIFSLVMNTIILPLITEFWTGLGIAITSITVDVVWDDVSIRVETPDSAILIGMHGKNIAIFQHLLSRMIERKTAKFVHVHLEINDYMKLKDEKLMQFIDSKILLIQSKWGSIRIPSLTPYERKKAHNYIAELAIIWLWTQSEGEWIERILVLSYTGVILPISQTDHIIPTKMEPIISDDGVGI